MLLTLRTGDRVQIDVAGAFRSMPKEWHEGRASHPLDGQHATVLNTESRGEIVVWVDAERDFGTYGLGCLIKLDTPSVALDLPSITERLDFWKSQKPNHHAEIDFIVIERIERTLASLNTSHTAAPRQQLPPDHKCG